MNCGEGSPCYNIQRCTSYTSLNYQIQSNATDFTGFTEDLCASLKIRIRPQDFLPYRPTLFIFPELQNQLYSVAKLKSSSDSPSVANSVI